jgi:hypothetical protein
MDFDKRHNLSKRNVKLILKIFSDLEPLRGSSNKKMSYSSRSCVIVIYIISGIKELLQDSNVEIADDEDVARVHL